MNRAPRKTTKPNISLSCLYLQTLLKEGSCHPFSLLSSFVFSHSSTNLPPFEKKISRINILSLEWVCFSFLKLVCYLKALGLISLQLTSYFFGYNFRLLHKLYLTFSWTQRRYIVISKATLFFFKFFVVFCYKLHLRHVES